MDHRILIDGEWAGAEDGGAFENPNPANPDDVIGNVPMSTVEDARPAAIQAYVQSRTDA